MLEKTTKTTTICLNGGNNHCRKIVLLLDIKIWLCHFIAVTVLASTVL